MDNPVHVLNRIQRRNRQHPLRLRRQSLRMPRRVVVNPLRERFQIPAELRRLLLQPLLGTLRHGVRPHPLIAFQPGRPEILRRPAARFAIEVQQQIPVALRLRITVPVKQILGRFRVNMRDPELIPDDFRPFLRRSARKHGTKHEEHGEYPIHQITRNLNSKSPATWLG